MTLSAMWTKLYIKIFEKMANFCLKTDFLDIDTFMNKLQTFHEWLEDRDSQLYQEIWGGETLRSAGRWLGKKVMPLAAIGAGMALGGASHAPTTTPPAAVATKSPEDVEVQRRIDAEDAVSKQRSVADDEYGQALQQFYTKYGNHPYLKGMSWRQIQDKLPLMRGTGMISQDELPDDWDKDLNRTSANVRKMNTPPRTDVDDFMDKVNKR